MILCVVFNHYVSYYKLISYLFYDWYIIFAYIFNVLDIQIAYIYHRAITS